MKKINVLSLFNGMSFGAMALETLSIQVGNYYSSEIDKYANQATMTLYPDTIQLGDVTKWREWNIDWSSIDLLIAGFPCQAWSMAGKQNGDNDPRGALVHDLIDIWNEIKYHNPDMKFMFENVKMKKEFLHYINELFGVEPICINSSLVSAQNRVRYYWTNIGQLEQPEDKGIVLADIIEHRIVDRDKSYCIDANYFKGVNPEQYFNKSRRQLVFLGGLDNGLRLNDGKKLSRNYREGYRIYSIHGKSATLTAQPKGGPGGYSGLYGEFFITQRPRGNNPGGDRAKNGKTPCMSANSWQHNNHLTDGIKYRKLTPQECMRLQTVPECHISTLLNAGISNTQLYKMTGNGWTHDVITHIFKGLNND